MAVPGCCPVRPPCSVANGLTDELKMNCSKLKATMDISDELSHIMTPQCMERTPIMPTQITLVHVGKRLLMKPKIFLNYICNKS